MSDSLIKGKTWFWRQGLQRKPIHSYNDIDCVYKTTELYTQVNDMNQAQSIIQELKQVGIKLHSKKTHSSYDLVPEGTLIVFAMLSQDEDLAEERKNIAKLKSYIFENGGKVYENRQEPSVLKKLMQNLFGRR